MTSVQLCMTLLLLGAVGCRDGPRDSSRERRGLFSNLLDNAEIPRAVQEQLDRAEVLFKTSDYTTKHGYPLETHTVTTEDGYLLTLHRIPGSPRAPTSGVKTPVLVQHGVGMASENWVMTGPEKALGFLLADEGYDVWLGNARGNKYSRKHVTMSSKDIAFYNFTWHEMGYYDLPAVIDYVLLTTNHTTLFYVGHSMGTTMFFALASTRPEYNQKIRLMVAMAPAAYIWGLRTALQLAIPFTRNIVEGFLTAREGQLLIRLMPLARLLNAFCGDGKPFQEICIFTYFTTVGFNRKELNTTLLPSMLTHLLTGYSIQMLYHYSQNIQSGRFQKFQRGPRFNKHNVEYDLDKVTAPVAVIYSQGDFIVPAKGVEHLSRKLPNLAKMILVRDKRVNHMDYVYAIHTKELFYNDIIDLLSKN